MKATRIGSLVLTVVLAGCAGVPAHVPQVGLPAEHRIGAGDILEIQVWEAPLLSGAIEVAEDGTLLHPVYRQIRVTGRTHAEAEDAVRAVLQTFVAVPRFVVQPLIRVAVIGDVRSPGVQTVRPGASVTDVIISAGGMLEAAVPSRVRLVRDGREHVIPIRTDAARMRLQPGDQVLTIRRRSALRDVIGPVSSLAAVTVSLVNLYVRTR
jgi:protein involved in polysaccharide export with SLBB domain